MRFLCGLALQGMRGLAVQSVTALPSSAVSPAALSGILADSVALERARLMRRLLVKRCGGLAALVLALALSAHASLAVRTIAPGVLVTPAVWAWVAEMSLARRLGRRLDAVPGSGAFAVPGEALQVLRVEKS
jgi:hypothetical protein